MPSAAKRKPSPEPDMGDGGQSTRRSANPRARDVSSPANDSSVTGRKRWQPLTHAEVHTIAAKVRMNGRHASADVALFYMLLATGAKPLELARVRVRDVLAPDGSIRSDATLPASASICGEPRPMYLRSQPVREALADYVRFRQANGHCTSNSGRYHGLDPDSMLFVDGAGRPYEIEIHGPKGNRYLCRGILEASRRIFRQSGIPGLCSKTLRRTLANRLHARGATVDEIGDVLGMRDRRTVRQLLDLPPARTKNLGDLFDDIVPMAERRRDDDTPSGPETLS